MSLMKHTDSIEVVHNFATSDVMSEILFKIQVEKMDKAVHAMFADQGVYYSYSQYLDMRTI